jgi:ribulose-bisphosphate carboxylase large chain
MLPEDRQAFFAEEASIDPEECVILTYWFETDGDPRDAAAALCMEQSTAQWKRPGVDEDFRPAHAAKVIGLDVVDTSRFPSFDSPFVKDGKFSRCVVRIAHPHYNFGTKIPNLLTAVAGEGIFYCHNINAIKLIDIVFPCSYLEEFEGPRFGVDGLRKLLNVKDRPLFFGVIKPNIGLDVESFAELAYQSWLGGLDVAKDDEMLSDVSWSPLKERAAKVGRKRLEAEQVTGRQKIYVANITDEVDHLHELHDVAVAAGANAVLVNGMATGLSAIRKLRRHTDVPIVGHFAVIAPFCRVPFYGVDSTVITKLQRMVGFDAIIMPGFGTRMMTTDEEVLANCDSCSQPMGSFPRSIPVPGGSEWAGSLAAMLDRLKTIDFGVVPGRGVFGHPMGPSGGARSLHQAWEAYLLKTPVEEYAKDHPELEAAIEEFGKNKTKEFQVSTSWRSTNEENSSHDRDAVRSRIQR